MKMIHHEDFRQFPPLLIEENAASPAPVRPELDSAFLHDLFDNLSQALLIVSNAGTILDANRSATTVARTRLDELLGRPLSDLFPDLDINPRGVLEPGFDAVAGKSANFSRHLLCLPPNPTLAPVTVSVVPTAPRSDGVWALAMECPTPDIHSPHSNDRHESRLRNITDTVPGALFQFLRTPDGEQAMLFMSAGSKKLLGTDLPTETITLSHLFALVVDSDKAPLQASIDAAFENHSEWSHEFRVQTSAGIVKWIRGQSVPEPKQMDGSVIWNGLLHDVTEEKLLHTKLGHQAAHDSLTGLVNRSEFERRLRDCISARQRNGGQSFLAFLDLDQFKIVNDTCGHIAGDELLRQISTILATHMRATDTLARLGGDEFAILMGECSLRHAQTVMNRIREIIFDYRFPWEGRSFHLGASIGLVSIGAEMGDVAEAMKRADTACYVAKDNGRNRVHLYALDDEAVNLRNEEMQWIGRLNDALEHDRFRLYAQTIAPLGPTPREDIHCELLIRLLDPDGKVLSPGAFLPAAERYGLASRIDRWVIGTLFKWISKHKLNVSADALFCINLSGLSLGDEETLDFIIRKMDEHRIPGKLLCFEITETAAIANLTLATRFIQITKSRGCRFALDDFGSGLSSFGYLKTLDVDFLKIDGMFVKGMLGDAVDYAMVKSINEIGHVMGIRTIAEFVENAEIMAAVEGLGVNFAQGYAVSRPQPLDWLLQGASACAERA